MTSRFILKFDWSVNLEDTTDIEKQICSVHTTVRPLSSFPNGFEGQAKSEGFAAVNAERFLLNSLLATIQRYDPDVIVGHEFGGTALDVLLHRMKDVKADHFSRIGRLRRQKWPVLKQGLNTNLLSGRLLCDLSSEGSRVSSKVWLLW